MIYNAKASCNESWCRSAATPDEPERPFALRPSFCLGPLQDPCRYLAVYANAGRPWFISS